MWVQPLGPGAILALRRVTVVRGIIYIDRRTYHVGVGVIYIYRRTGLGVCLGFHPRGVVGRLVPHLNLR